MPPKTKNIYDNPRLLGSMVRAGVPDAIQHVVDVLQRNDGNKTATAKAIGIGFRTLCEWVEEVPAFARAIKKVSLKRGDFAKRQSEKRKAAEE